MSPCISQVVQLVWAGDILFHLLELTYRYDNGIMDIKATHVEIKGEPEVVWTEDSGGEVLHYTVVTDRGVSYNSAVQKFEDFKDTLEDCEDGEVFTSQGRHFVAQLVCT